ncbi:membrane associated rhomboid family serine protease [Bradyrhizobium japonicum]
MDSPQDSPPEPPAAVEEAPREPILTLPIALTAYILLLAVIHLRVLLPPELENWTIDVFGFIPKRYDSSLLNLQIPGGAGAKVWTFVTYSLLHANLTHLGFNVLWLLPFGSALARRFGAIRFFLFLAVTAAAGALAHLVTHEHAVAPMIGASASVSGAMAAAIRFAFVRGSFLSFNRSDADTAARVPALPLSRALRDGRVVGFLAVWFGVNIIFGGRRDRRRFRNHERRLAGAYRRLLRGPSAVRAVRSRAARAKRCCGCVITGHFKPHLKRRLRRRPNSSIISDKNVPKRQAASGDASQSASACNRRLNC